MDKFNINELRFIVGVSTATKIDPRVVAAWVKQEGADAPNGTGHFNYLNLRTGGQFVHFNSVNESIKATVARLNQPFAKQILATAQTKPTPKQEIAAIASTGWDESHYGGGGGVNLLNALSSIGVDPNSAYLPPGDYKGPGSNSGNANTEAAGTLNAGARHIPGVAQVEGAVGAVASVGDAFSWAFANWDRILLVLGGVILVVLGIGWIGRKQIATVRSGGSGEISGGNPVTPESTARFQNPPGG